MCLASDYILKEDLTRLADRLDGTCMKKKKTGVKDDTKFFGRATRIVINLIRKDKKGRYKKEYQQFNFGHVKFAIPNNYPTKYQIGGFMCKSGIPQRDVGWRYKLEDHQNIQDSKSQWDAWVAQLVGQLPSAWVMIPASWD